LKILILVFLIYIYFNYHVLKYFKKVSWQHVDINIGGNFLELKNIQGLRRFLLCLMCRTFNFDLISTSLILARLLQSVEPGGGGGGGVGGEQINNNIA